GLAMPEMRIRAAVAVVQAGRILLVPHYDTEAGPVQWTVPGGRVAFGEPVRVAAAREFREETGLTARIGDVLAVSEVIQPGYHSLTITFAGTITGGTLHAKPDHPHGDKTPRWLSADDRAGVPYHPPDGVARALGLAAQ
ncbi:MAG: NUDIX domain-containing protein, partial [Anaerolineae bacterium]|nr:NUDIX domain-containing protein [Anaerolineae bacterium]